MSDLTTVSRFVMLASLVIVPCLLRCFVALTAAAAFQHARVKFAEVYRVLKPTGKFIVISHAGEHPDLQVSPRYFFLPRIF